MKKLLLAIICTLPILSHAETLFYCKTTNGKQVKVEKHGKIVSYAFGKNLKKPELALRQYNKDIEYTGEADFDYWANVIIISNGDYSYRLYSGEEDDKKFGGINVLYNNRTLAELKCIPSSMLK